MTTYLKGIIYMNRKTYNEAMRILELLDKKIDYAINVIEENIKKDNYVTHNCFKTITRT